MQKIGDMLANKGLFSTYPILSYLTLVLQKNYRLENTIGVSMGCCDSILIYFICLGFMLLLFHSDLEPYS